MHFWDKIEETQKKLVVLGHQIYTPSKEGTDIDYEALTHKQQISLKKTFIDRHMERIQKSDSILVLNYHKNGVKNYIGANTFMEMAFAYLLNKKIFVLFNLPHQPNTLEIEALGPIIISEDLSKIN